MQTYFRRDAIASCNQHNVVYDQRLLLVLDGTDLVGAAVHALTEADDPAGFRERALVAYAVSVDHQGKSLSDGRRASAAVLNAVFMDIASRHGEEQVVFLHASVHSANEASRTVLNRHGVQHNSTDGDYTLYTARLC
ncbi:hypothetical protein [Streptomyces sp. NPDC090798]|uniref:hypothetical protein n=1 Tax=Streptomyces sp. NPDC090798 TaxID=3365968 RepID=UPI0037F60DC1